MGVQRYGERRPQHIRNSLRKDDAPPQILRTDLNHRELKRTDAVVEKETVEGLLHRLKTAKYFEPNGKITPSSKVIISQGERWEDGWDKAFDEACKIYPATSRWDEEATTARLAIRAARWDPKLDAVRKSIKAALEPVLKAMPEDFDSNTRKAVLTSLVGDATLLGDLLTLGTKIKDWTEHLEHAKERVEFWLNGYALHSYVNRVAILYCKRPKEAEQATGSAMAA